MNTLENSRLEIVGSYIEVDRTLRGKYWLWLKVMAELTLPAQVRISFDPVSKGSLFIERGGEYGVSEMSLGFHALEPGLNELPPLPFTVIPVEKQPLIINIWIESLKCKTDHHQVSESVFFSPFLIFNSGAVRPILRG